MKLEKDFVLGLKEEYGDDYKLILKAIKFADRKHKGAKRDDGTPYISHPMRVAEFVRKFKKSKNKTKLYIAALLHDTIEDTYTSYTELCKKFGETSASIVMELSTARFDSMWIEKSQKADYLSKKMSFMTNYALTVKFCDRLDNVLTLDGVTKEKRERTLADTRYIIDFVSAARELTGTQKRVIAEIEKAMEKYKKES
ncbi:MAG: HD domain-containing protein [Clostridia bacterium]|nr:HD domain-containing protein [Clostridia bacterium]